MAVMFDTHKQHQSLTAAGFTESQADAVTGMATAVLSVVATKADLEKFEAKMDARFEALEKRFDDRFGDFNKTLNRMNSLMIGHISATIGGVGIIVGAMFAVIAPHIR